MKGDASCHGVVVIIITMKEQQVIIRPLMLLGVGVAALVPWLFSRYELRIGRAVNSPMLSGILW